MLSLKKYFTEGLIQFTILLSLVGVRVDVDTYLSSQLPPLREIILGPSSAYTQTQFHHLPRTLGGYGIHPKSVELDSFFGSRRLLSQVRALGRLQVPSTELSAWLVHRDPEGSVSGGQQEGGGGDGGVRDSAAEQGFGDELEDLGAVAAPGNADLTKEDIDLIDILWRQDIDLGAGREIFDYGHRQKESEVDKELSDGRERGDGWRSAGSEALERIPLVDGEPGDSFPAQVPGAEDQTALSLEECLRLLEATFPFGDNSEFPASDVPALSEAVPGQSRAPGSSPSLLSPLLAETESPFDLEQQWQDLMSIMEMQAMEVNSTESLYGSSSSTGDLLASSYSLAPGTPINQNVSLHQASLGSCSQDFSLFSPDMESPSGGPALLQLAPDNSSGLGGTFGSTNLSGIFFPPQLNAAKKSGKEKPSELLDKQLSRDEHRARAMKIPFTNDKIINLPVEEFNELLSKYQLSEAQLSLIRDIRRRGKNKMAAQNCRKRKLDTILNLERDVEELRRDKSKLLREKVEFLKSIRQMKQKVQSLYQEVFGRLRDEQGRPYSPSRYALTYGSDGSVLLVPRPPAQPRRHERRHRERRK